MTKVVCWKLDCKHYRFLQAEPGEEKHQCGADKIRLGIFIDDPKIRHCTTYEKLGKGGKWKSS